MDKDQRKMTVTTVTSVEGVTYEPWTDGWAIGFRVTHPQRPTVYVYLNPAGEVDTGDVDDSSVFVYHGPAGEPGPDDGPVSYINMWDGGEPGE